MGSKRRLRMFLWAKKGGERPLVIRVSELDAVRVALRTRKNVVHGEPSGRKLTDDERIRAAWGNLSVEIPALTIDEVREAVQAAD